MVKQKVKGNSQRTKLSQINPRLGQPCEGKFVSDSRTLSYAIHTLTAHYKTFNAKRNWGPSAPSLLPRKPSVAHSSSLHLIMALMLWLMYHGSNVP